MAVAFSARSWVRLSFRISDVREDVLLSNIVFQRMREYIKRTFRPLLGVIARLVELPNRISRCLRWREEFGASEESGCRPQLSSVCCLRRPQESVTFSVRFTRTLTPSFLLFFCFSWSSMAPLKSCSRSPFSSRASRFLISSLMLPIPSSCCLRPGATRRIRRGVLRAILLHSLLGWGRCVGLSRMRGGGKHKDKRNRAAKKKGREHEETGAEGR